MKWVALFSQTGSEIIELSKALGRKPDLILTNNQDYKTYHPEISTCCYTVTARHDALMELLLKDELIKGALVTLHGYLRIIPPNVCAQFEMYNGHPGAIELYPELKGKDPQVRAWNNRELYHNIGSVVHRVTEGVDEGEVVSAVNYVNRVENLDEMYCKLKETSLQSWLFFLKRRLNENRN